VEPAEGIPVKSGGLKKKAGKKADPRVYREQKGKRKW